MTTPKEGNTKKPTTEIITPHRLVIAILIKNYCDYRDLDEFKQMEDEALMCRYRRDFCVLTLKLLQSPDLNLEELRELLVTTKYKIPKTVVSNFFTTLSNIFQNGTGYMLDIIDSFNSVLSHKDNTPKETKNSTIGFYLRRLIVSFEKLSFSEVTAVYLSFQRYYSEWQRITKSEERMGDEINVVNSDDWCADRELWSRRQAELFIATQAALLTNNEEKALPPPELQNRISSLLKSNPDLSEAHFLSYLNYLRVKEFCGSLESLYHCFDRNAVLDNKGSNDEKSKGYRFAALNLAVLHYHFGYQEEALASLKEAIKISQEANDNVCLQHALSWLYQLTITNKNKLIVHSVLKSFQLNLTYTTSLGLQTFVQHGCAVSGNPYQIFETLTKSDIINCQHNHRDLISNSYAVKSCLWHYYGKSEMSSLWSQLLLYLNIDCASPSKAFYGEGFCLSLCNLANQQLLEGEYDAAYTIINLAKTKFPHEPHSLLWMLTENLFTFIRSLHAENWLEAESAAQKLVVLDKWEGYLRLAELYFQKQDFNVASNCLNTLLSHYENEEIDKPKTDYYIRAKILLAEVHFASTYPEKVSTGIMNLLYSCLRETNKNHLDYYTAIIQTHIANIQLTLGLTGQALNLLDQSLVQILSMGGRFDQARASLLHIKCLVADSSRLQTSERNLVLVNAAGLLNKVKEDFEKVQAFSRVKDALYLQAHLYDVVGMKEERNKCALQFKALDEEQKTKNLCTLFKYL